MENMSKSATFALDELTPALKTQFGARGVDEQSAT